MHFLNRLRALGKRGKLESDLDEELQFHVEMKTRENVEAGMPPGEARTAALRQFGNLARVVEEARAAWGWTWLEQLARDLRFALRTLRRNAGFTAVAGLSLALGIGANAAIFTLVNAILLRPLPYAQPERLVRVTGYYPDGAVAALQERSRTMEVASYSDKPENGSEFNLTGDGIPMHLTGSAVSANLFSLLGATAELGRTFQPGEDRAGQDRVVILSHALWRDRYDSDPRILGGVISLNGVDRRVVGVMPRAFEFLVPNVQLWIPLHIDPRDPDASWGPGFKPLVARLRPGANVAQARNEIRGLVAQIIRMFPYAMARSWNADATVLPLQQDLVGNVRAKLLVLLGAVGLVLLIACANVASLMLARSTGRRKEIALRAALGAGRGRIVRQLLTESVVLSVAGGALGLTLAFGALNALRSRLPMDTPRLAEVTMDWRVVAFAAALTFLTGLLFGLVPALQASKLNLTESLKAGGRRGTDTSGIQVRSSLIVAEVALAVVLVTSAGLLIRTLWRLTQVDPGFRSEHVVTVRVTPDASTCRTREACVALYEELLRRARDLPEVSEVAAANTIPLSGEVPYVVAEMQDRPLVAGENLAPLLWTGAVTPDYFHLMGIRLLAGRELTDSDNVNSSGVVIVSAATARRYWPGENPIGKHIRLVWDKDWRTVVGVVQDVRQFNLADRPLDWVQGRIYMPYPQSSGADEKQPTAMYLIARTTEKPSLLARDIRVLVQSVNPNVPVSEVRALPAIVSASTNSSRSLMWLFVSFAGAAFLLAVIGIYGVVSYSAAQRTYEMGVRVALGATRGNILGLVIGHGLRLALAGLALGTLASLVLTRLLAGFLYGVSPGDPLTFLAVSTLLTSVALVASYLPARRAAAVDPMQALRHE
jgi:predicted permease